MKRVIAAVLAGSLLGGGGVAVAQQLITSAQIKNGTIKCIDLRPALCEQISREPQVGPRGPQGEQGPVGPQGPPGRDGKDGGPITTPPPDTERVSVLTGDWGGNVDNCLGGPWSDLGIVSDGIRFGPFIDGGARGTVTFKGLAGHRLDEFEGFTYTTHYTQIPDAGEGAASLRLLTADLEAVIDFIPTSTKAGEWQTWTIGPETPVYLTSAGRSLLTFREAVQAHGARDLGEIRLGVGCGRDKTAGLTSKVGSLTATVAGTTHSYTFSN